MKTKVPLPAIKTRGTETQIVAATLATGTPPWQAANFISPENLLNLLNDLTTQENLLSLKDAALAVSAGEWDNILNPWHEESVAVLKLGRVIFASTPKAPAWRSLSANGQSRAVITKEGTDIESAWQSSNPAWVPKQGLTFANFQARRTTADTKARLWALADKAVDEERGVMIDMANHIYDLCVDWYTQATATFDKNTPEGALIRTIPVNYDPNEAPGQLQFTQHFSPAPNQVKLLWEAARGEHYNLYAKMPGALEFNQIASNVSQASWMGEGLTAGDWMFKAEAKNAAGLGEMSVIITVPVAAAMAA